MKQITTVTLGDTELDVHFIMDNGIVIEDVCIANTDISVYEMIHSLNWEKFYTLVGQNV